jgi:hypothetical protein
LSRLPPEPRLPEPPQEADEHLRLLYRELVDYLRAIHQQVNLISEGNIVGSYQAVTAEPTGRIMRIGDVVQNINPSETGTVGSKYTLAGWRCVVDGTASASSLVDMRVPTGG